MTLILSYTAAGTPGGRPTLAEAVADLRRDLFDRAQGVDAGVAPRWDDDDLARALDRAVDEYSLVAPLIGAAMTATLPHTRSYAYPPGAWWIESVEYPSGLYLPVLIPFEEGVTPSLGAPSRAPAAASGGAGPLDGTYTWGVTFFKSGGETVPGPYSAPLTLQGGAALLSGIPLGPPGTVGRNVYRARLDMGAAPGSAGVPPVPVASDPSQGARLAGQLFDNTATEWVDAAPDSLLGAAAPAADTTANLAQFTLKLPPGRLPAGVDGALTVTYAGKHGLTLAGTSIPARHRDVVLLGAAAHAMLAYQAGTNDLFEYQDGEMRDRVDERTVPTAWLTAGTHLLTRFQSKLKEIKGQRNAGIAAVARWGDTPARWRWT